MSAHRLLQDLRVAEFGSTDPGDAGELRVSKYGEVFPIVTATAETRTLLAPTQPGLICTVVLDTDGGDCTLTVTGGYNEAGDTTIVFDDAGDHVVFSSIQTATTTYAWRVLGQEGTDAGGEVGDLGVSGTMTLANPPKTTSGLGAKNGATVAAVEYGDGIVHKTVLTLTAHNTTMADEGGVIAYGGSKIYDFPAGSILVLGAVVDLTVTKSGNGINADFDGDCALGTTVATNANNALASTEADILASFATNQAVNGVAAVEGQGSTIIAATLNGVATAKDVYLNYLIDDADQNIGTTAAYLLSSGTITLHWINLGDIA